MQSQEKERESKGTENVGTTQNNHIQQRDTYMQRKVK